MLADKIAYYGHAMSPLILAQLGLTRADFEPIRQALHVAGDGAAARAMVTRDMLQIGIAGKARDMLPRGWSGWWSWARGISVSVRPWVRISWRLSRRWAKSCCRIFEPPNRLERRVAGASQRLARTHKTVTNGAGDPWGRPCKDRFGGGCHLPVGVSAKRPYDGTYNIGIRLC